ncbi:MAG: Ribosomal large subunit pseudouridine synthase D [Syntrophus sp. SKADARSKE-3]|nr:Ribosomal large subunit pseudouridine synthase D [Syntrophus sp. SKADARSKE-3]
MTENGDASSPIISRHTVCQQDADMRLDLFLSREHAPMSRSQIQKLVEQCRVLVNGRSTKTGYKLKRNDIIEMHVPAPVPSQIVPEAMDLNILYEDAFLLVLDKPAGVVVHPAAGHHDGTLVHGLLDHCSDLSGIGGVLRPGIVHRLDKDTSGLMVVAKTDFVHRALSDQFKARQVKKTYQAFVYGDIANESGVIDLPIGRHPVARQMMSTKGRRGKAALSRWEVRERFGVATLLDVSIETGRTHQIRVHLNAIGHPVIGDPIYGKGRGFKADRTPGWKEQLKKMNRQALHARVLNFLHPVRQIELEFVSPLPADMACLLDYLREIGG